MYFQYILQCTNIKAILQGNEKFKYHLEAQFIKYNCT